MSDELINPADASLPSTPQELSQSDTLHLAAIGMVASGWAGFEVLIDTFALQLARSRGSWGYCFTAQVIGPARKLDAYISVARLRGADKFIPELESFVKDTVGLGERRNRVVHDP